MDQHVTDRGAPAGEGAYARSAVLTVAVDATPLLGDRTGIGAVTAGASVPSPATRSGLIGYGLTGPGGRRLAAALPAGRAGGPSADAGGAAAAVVAGRSTVPAIEWWTGPVDVVHGTNFVVPPARRAARVVSVHDLTPVRFPELCSPASLAYPALIRRAIAGARRAHPDRRPWPTRSSSFSGAPAERVRVVHHGIDRRRLRLPRAPGRRARPTSSASARSSPARTSRPGPGLRPGGGDPPPISTSSSPARPVGARTPWSGPSPAAAHRDRIRRLGWVDDAERATLLARAAGVRLPVGLRGFRASPARGHGRGVPGGGHRGGSVPEVVGGAARLVPVGDEAALAAALADVLDDEAERARLIAAGRARAALFTWPRCADGVARIYRDAARMREDRA